MGENGKKRKERGGKRQGIRVREEGCLLMLRGMDAPAYIYITVRFLADRTQVAVELLVRVVTRLSVCLNGYIMAKL